MIILTAVYNKHYQQLADITLTNKKEYCSRMGYEHAFKNKDFVQPIPDGPQPDGGHMISFEPFYLYPELMKDKSIEWIWFTPVDGLVTNMTIKLESIIDKFPGANWLVGADFNNINCNNILIRNCDWSREFIDFILSKKEEYRGKNGHEQQIIIDNLNTDKWGPYIKVMPQRMINSYQHSLYPLSKPFDYMGNDGEWQFGDSTLCRGNGLVKGL